MDLAVRVLLVGLAAWRVSALLSYERGPFGVFEWFRSLVAPEADEDGAVVAYDPLIYARVELETALACPWCLSPWTAGAFWLLWELSPVAVAVLAAAAIVVISERLARP